MKRTEKKITRQHGFTLLEAMVVTSIIGAMMVIAVPNTKTMFANYRLHVATQSVKAGIHLARAKAVAENFNFKVQNSTGQTDFFHVEGSENDQGDILQPWEDRNQNGVKDSVTYDNVNLPGSIRFILAGTVSPAVPVSGAPNASTSEISFNPLGAALINGSAVAVYLKNELDTKTAVTVDRSGRVLSWKLEGSDWRIQ